MPSLEIAALELPSHVGKSLKCLGYGCVFLAGLTPGTVTLSGCDPLP